MSKILHTADIHLGAKFSVLGEKAVQYREQIKKTFVKVIDLALKQKVDLLLVAGDLFDSNFPAGQTLSLVKDQFKRLADKNISVAILAGTHDCLNDDSVYWREDFGKNVFVFKKEGGRIYPELDLTIWAKPNTANQSKENPLISSRNMPRHVPTKTKYNIALAHGSVVGLAAKIADNQFPMSLTELINTPFDYIALGHWHSLVEPEKFQNKACYPGSPEPIDFSQRGAGYAVIVETRHGVSLQIKPIKIGTIDFDQLEIDLSLIESTEQLKKEILKGASEDLIRQVKLRGLVPADFNLDLAALEEELSEKFFRLIINNQSQLTTEPLEATKYPQELVIGQFVRLMEASLKNTKSEREKRINQQALQIGLAMLQNQGFEI